VYKGVKSHIQNCRNLLASSGVAKGGGHWCMSPCRRTGKFFNSSRFYRDHGRHQRTEWLTNRRSMNSIRSITWLFVTCTKPVELGFGWIKLQSKRGIWICEVDDTGWETGYQGRSRWYWTVIVGLCVICEKMILNRVRVKNGTYGSGALCINDEQHRT